VYWAGGVPTIFGNLASETNPETGTITYQYDSNNRMTTRTDAKGWQVLYTYDGLGRVTRRSYNQPWNGINAAEYSDVQYHYDDAVDAQFTQNGWGRLTGVDFSGRTENISFQYLYSYNTAGRVTGQRMVVKRPPPGASPGNGSATVEASYGWDNEGRMTSLQEPNGGPLDTYAYDQMGRLASGGATYGPAGELLTFNGVSRS
jgi:YD repeat-containing protein